MILCLFFSSPSSAQTQAAKTTDGPDYVTGQVEEILSEKTIVDEAFGHQEKKFRFKVRFPSKQGQPAETVIVEQAYTPETPTELMPAKGKKYIFFQDQLVDGSRNYTLVDVQRSDHLALTMVLTALILLGIARWYGLKPLLTTGSMVASFFVCHLLHLPWLLLSLVTLAVTLTAAGLLSFGATRRLSVALSAASLSLGATLVLIWIGSWFSLVDPSALLAGSALLQMSAGLAYVVITTVNSVHLNYRNDPTLNPSELLKKSLVASRGAVEVVSSIYLLIFIAQVLTSTYGQNETPGLMQMEPVLAELVSLFFMLMGFALALPITSWLGVRMLYRRRV